MRALITNSLVTKLTPKEKQYDVRDTKLSGFMIRVNPSGKMHYVCQYKRGHRITIGRVDVITTAQARDKAISILGDAAKGLDPAFAKKKKTKMTLGQFLTDHYGPWVLEHRKSGQWTLDHIRRCFMAPFGDKPIEDITPSLTDQWRTQRLKNGRTTETANRDIATFKAALSKAVLWGFTEKHPLEKLKLLKSDRSIKVRYLTATEEANLRRVALERDIRIKGERARANEWRKSRDRDLYPDLSQQEFADYLHPMILISINTGLRRGEVFSLKWENVNFERAMITIEGMYAKSGKTRHIPINSEALRVLKSWRTQSGGSNLVFANKDGSQFDTVKKSWANLLEKAEIKNFRWHDLRHHFASKLVMAGVDLNTVRELLGHSDMAMTLRYAHLAPEHKAMAVEKLVISTQGII